MKSGGTVDQLATAVTVTSLLCQRTFQADSNPRPHSCLRPACKITVIVLLHCGRGGGGGGAGADTSRRTQARSGPMCSLHRGYYSHCHTAPCYATPPPPALAAELLAPAPSHHPDLGPGAGRGRGHGGDHWQCVVCTSVQASPATATLAGHQPPVCCDHRPLVWAVVWWRPAPGPAEPPAGRSPPLHSSTSQWRSCTLSSPWPPPCHSSPSPGHTLPCLSLSSLAWPCRDTPPNLCVSCNVGDFE